MRRSLFALLFIVCFTLNGAAQSYTISTYAGPALPISGVSAPSQAIDSPYGVVSDGAGGYYLSSFGPCRIYHVTASGQLSIIAGSGLPGFSGDDGPAISAQINGPMGLALDTAGNLYFADSANSRIRKITPGGIISTVAGTGTAGFAGDGGPATAAQIRTPRSIAVDASGNLYIADFNNFRIRKVTPAGTINTIAGTGTGAFGGDGGPAISATMNLPESVALDAAGNLYIAEPNSNRVRRITADGVINTVAGIGTAGFSGDGGAATSAQLSAPFSVAFDALGNMFIADTNNGRVRKVSPSGVISTAVGVAARGSAGDGGPATAAQLSLPYRLAFDSDGSMFIADSSGARVRKVSAAGIISTVGGNGTSGFSGDGGPATSAQLNTPYGVTVDSSGTLLVAEQNGNRVRRVSAAGIIGTVTGNGVGGFTGDGGAATSAQVRIPTDVVVDFQGNIYIADQSNFRVRKITPAGVISTYAGRGTQGFSGDGGAATAAQFTLPIGLAMDSYGDLFVADMTAHRIRKISPAGIITTVAGTGTAGSAGDGGAAINAQLNSPIGVAVDAAGNIFIADTNNHRIRKITPGGIINTIAGTGVAGFSGDGGQSINAQVNLPSGIALDTAGNVFIADSNNNRIRKISVAGVISTIAGAGTGGFRGDGGVATAAWFSQPRRVTVDASGNIFVADTGNQRVRELIPLKQPTSAFAVADRGGMSVQSLGTVAGTVNVGYARIDVDAGSPIPSGYATFGFRQNNVLVTEAAVPASPAIGSGRIYAEVGSGINTGLAIANPNDQPAAISFYFTDGSGNFGQGNTTIPANGQIARFLDQDPFNGRSTLSGSFTFASSIPVSVTALRGRINERSEFLLTTLPVADLGAAATTAPVVFPHFADGGGWTTQIVLVNPTDNTLTGNILFRDRSGQNADFGGTFNNTQAYSIAPRGSLKLTTAGTSSAILTGSVRVTPSGSGAAPTGVAIFSFRSGGIIVSEAGVPAQAAGTAFDLFAESIGDFSNGAVGSMRTGLAIANTSATATSVIVEVENLDGTTGLIGVVPVPANGQSSLFLNEIPGLESLITPFQGVLRLTSPSSAPITVIGLRARFNERADLLISTTPPANEATPQPATGLFFPHLADAGGYVTQFTLFSRGGGSTSTGMLRFFTQAGDR